jgi:hypothetical protein
MTDIKQLADQIKGSREAAAQKGFVQSDSPTTGLQAYDLLIPALKTIPLMTPFRDRLSRVGGGFGTAEAAKVITNINAQRVRAGVSEGARGGFIDHTLAEKSWVYRTWGLENYTTDEAKMAGVGFTDVDAEAVANLVMALPVTEELMIIGGNTSLALGANPTPALTAGAAGTLAAGTYYVKCVALTTQAYLEVAGYNNGGVGEVLDVATAEVPGQITRSNAGPTGGTTTFGGGSAAVSAAASVTTSGTTGSIAATVADTRGAFAWAWYLGASAAGARLTAVTTVPTVTLTALPDAGAQLATDIANGSNDNSTSALEFDGFLTIASDPSQGSYYANMAGQSLTFAGGRCVQIEAMMQRLWSRQRVIPDELHMSSETLSAFQAGLLASGTPGVTYMVDVNSASNTGLTMGASISAYVTQVMGRRVSLVPHPNIPPGTILAYTTQLPGFVQNVPGVARMKMRRDMYVEEFPRYARRREWGVYASGVLQHFVPATMGLIKGIAT